MKDRKQHWYHCTDKFHGPTWTAQRICPPSVKAQDIDEPRLPRLCVASNVCRCFAARFFNGKGEVYVYRTTKPRAALKAREVWDSIITQERWIIPPVEMQLVHTFSQDLVIQASAALYNYLCDGHSMDAKIRLYAFREAQTVLGNEWTTKADKEFVRKSIEYFEKKEAPVTPDKLAIENLDQRI